MPSRDDIIKLAREAGWNWPEVHTTSIEDRLERFAALVAAAEREACAKVCEESNAFDWPECAAAIRARSNP
jgi:hypothetical protein